VDICEKYFMVTGEPCYRARLTVSTIKSIRLLVLLQKLTFIVSCDVCLFH